MLLSEDERLLESSANALFRSKAPVSRLRMLRERAPGDRVDRELWNDMVKLGWSAIPWAEEHGGLAFGYRGLGVISWRAGRTLALTPLLGTVWLCGTLLNEAGSDDQKARYLSAISSGELLFALALEEAHKHRPLPTDTSAASTYGGLILQGRKCHVIDGGSADVYVVAARQQGGGVTLCLVPRGTKGVTIHSTDAVDPRDLADIQFDNVFVPEADILGEPGSEDQRLSRALDIGRIGLAAEMLGAAEEAFDRTVEYLKIRKQFGVPLGSLQSLKHRCAHMFCQLELARAVVDDALTAIDDGRSDDDVGRIASMTKATLGKCLHRVSREAVQMHGGIAMTDEADIGFFLKRAAFAEQALGDAHFHHGRFATLEGY